MANENKIKKEANEQGRETSIWLWLYLWSVCIIIFIYHATFIIAPVQSAHTDICERASANRRNADGWCTKSNEFRKSHHRQYVSIFHSSPLPVIYLSLCLALFITSFTEWEKRRSGKCMRENGIRTIWEKKKNIVRINSEAICTIDASQFFNFCWVSEFDAIDDIGTTPLSLGWYATMFSFLICTMRAECEWARCNIFQRQTKSMQCHRDRRLFPRCLSPWMPKKKEQNNIFIRNAFQVALFDAPFNMQLSIEFAPYLPFAVIYTSTQRCMAHSHIQIRCQNREERQNTGVCVCARVCHCHTLGCHCIRFRTFAALVHIVVRRENESKHTHTCSWT